MIAKVLEGAGGKVAEEWLPRLLTSSMIFWAGGLAAAIFRFGWRSVLDALNGQSEAIQIAFLIVVLAGAIASSMVVERFQLAALRGLEGYWPSVFRHQRRQLVAKQIASRKKIYQQWSKVAKAYKQQPNSELHSQYIQLQDRLEEFPKSDLMPTRFGNILRAAELRSLDKYGLDAVICWPRLWLLLPESAKADLQTARAELNAMARLWGWSWLFLVWTVWAWWAAPIALGSAWFAYQWAIAAAKTYGDLIEASFDLYRGLLYEALRLPFPKQADQEPAAGRMLTQYLWRGTLPESYQFIATSEISPVIDQ